MKKNLLRISMLVAFAAGVSQAQTAQLIADVPFQFTVGTHSMPAGTYLVATSASFKTIKLVTPDNRSIATLGTRAIALHYTSTAKLVFHRYGNRYFLSEVWASDTDNGWRLPPSRQEQEQVARSSAPTRVFIALK